MAEWGLSKPKQLKPDIVVLDLSMPVMNGLEAAPNSANYYASYADSDVHGLHEHNSGKRGSSGGGKQGRVQDKST